MENFYIIILVVFASYFIAQFCKIFTHKNLTFKKFIFGTGGMPSAHTAAVVSLPLIIFILEGLTVNLSIGLILAVIVIRDALGVRYAVGHNAKILSKKFSGLIISEGHTLKDVLVGAMIGVIIPLLVFLW